MAAYRRRDQIGNGNEFPFLSSGRVNFPFENQKSTFPGPTLIEPDIQTKLSKCIHVTLSALLNCLVVFLIFFVHNFIVLFYFSL